MIVSRRSYLLTGVSRSIVVSAKKPAQIDAAEAEAQRRYRELLQRTGARA